MSYFPTDIPFMSDEELIENGLKKPYKKPEIIDSKDLVPVVRCRNCKYWDKYKNYCHENRRIFLGYHYCAYGERKE